MAQLEICEDCRHPCT